MNTTNLFVELVMIGVGAIIWVIMLLMTVLGYQPFCDLLVYIKQMELGEMSVLVGAIPVFSVIYVLGIVTDRVANGIFDQLWGKKLKSECFKTQNEEQARVQLFEKRHIIYTQSEYLSVKLEYGRSRLRVCRGWTLNSVLILVCTLLFLWTQLSDDSQMLKLSAIITLFWGGLAGATWWTWRKLIITEYQQINKQAASLSGEGGMKSFVVKQ